MSAPKVQEIKSSLIEQREKVVSSMMIAHGTCISSYFLDLFNQNFLLMFMCNNIQPVLLKNGWHVIFIISVLHDNFSPILCSDLSRSFCSCLVKPAAGSADLKELVGVNLEFQVCLFSQLYYKSVICRC